MSHQLLPDSYEGILDQARTALQIGDPEHSIELYRRLLERLRRLSGRILARRPELGEMQLQSSLELTGLLRVEGRYAEAIEILQQTLESHPQDTAARRRDLATLRTAKGEVQRGLAELQALADRQPDDVRNWLVLGNEARIEGWFAESQAALDRALEAAKRGGAKELLAEVHYQRFCLFRDMGHIDSALSAWEKAASSQSELGGTVQEVYAMLSQAGRYTEALRYVARDENKLQAGFHRGFIAHLMGDRNKAKQEWQAVAQLDPTQFEYGHDCWTEAVLRLGDPTPTLEKLPPLLAQYSTARLLVLSGIAWAMREEPGPAARFFQDAIGLLRRGRPAKQKLDSADWRLLDSLVASRELKAALRPYFAIVETVWEEAPRLDGWDDRATMRRLDRGF